MMTKNSSSSSSSNNNNYSSSSLPMSTNRVVLRSVSVLLTQLEDQDASAALSFGILCSRKTTSGAANAAAGIIRLANKIRPRSKASYAANDTTGSISTVEDDDMTERTSCTSCTNDDDTISVASSNTTQSMNQKYIRKNNNQRGVRARRIEANGNTLRHFLLEFTATDGTIYTMEKLLRGTFLYKGTSTRKIDHPYTTVSTIPLNEKTTKGNKAVTLADLEKIFNEQRQIPYHILQSNCKRFSYTVLTTLVNGDCLPNVWPKKADHKAQKYGKEHVGTVPSSYSCFRDTCQFLDRRLRLQAQ